jgi:hypothetical protein
MHLGEYVRTIIIEPIEEAPDEPVAAVEANEPGPQLVAAPVPADR